jgi:hypothetical protein
MLRGKPAKILLNEHCSRKGLSFSYNLGMIIRYMDQFIIVLTRGEY